MNWMIRYAQQGIALSISALEELTNNLGGEGYLDIPGQQYMWEGEGWDQLRQTRKLGQNELALMIKYFHMMFEAIADELRVETDEIYSWEDKKRYKVSVPEVNTESDPEQLKEQMAETASALVESWDWGSRRQDEWISFIKHLGSEDESAEMLFDAAFKSTELPTPEEFQKILALVQAYEAQWNSEGKPHDFSSEQLRVVYENEARDPNTDPNEYNELMSRITEEITYELIDNDELYSRDQKDLVPHDALQAMGINWNNQKELDYLPAWITQQKLQEAADDAFYNSDELGNWYMEENKQMLEQDADESIYEYNREGMREKVAEFVKNYGYDVFGTLAEDYDPDDTTDERRDLELDAVWDLMQDMEQELGHMADSVRDASAWAEMYIAAIKTAAERNSHIADMFSQQLNAITIDQERMFRGIGDAAKTSPQSIPDEFEEEEVRNIIEYLKRKETRQELDESTGKITPEQSERLREMGISENPFPSQYQLRQRLYPEHGYQNIVPSVLKPFEIAVGADESAQLPSGLIDKISPWEEDKPSVPAIGWLGGYTDVPNSVMYITKVKSPLMDQTSEMQTTEQHQAYWQQQIQDIDQQLAQLPTMGLDPTAMEQKKEELEGEKQRAQWKIDWQRQQPSLSEWSGLRQQVEESFKDWVAVFFNIAIREAVFWAFDKVRIVSAETIMDSLYSYDQTAKEKAVMEKIYDQTAQKYNATSVTAFGKTFWEIDLQSENLRYASRIQRWTTGSRKLLENKQKTNG